MNFCFMLNKITTLFIMAPLAIVNTSSTSLTPIVVKGEVNLSDLNEDILLYLSVEKGLLNEVILLDLYVNNKEIYYKKEFVASYLDNEPIKLDGFKNVDETKNIRINIGYREMRVEDSYISFNLSSPTYSDYLIYNEVYENPNPINILFYMNHNNPKIYYEYESIEFYGNKKIELKDKRVLDFNDFNFKINSSMPYKLDYIELKIYYKFKYSDLYYVNDNYTIIEVPIYEDKSNNYRIENDIKYYIDENNGGIYINQSKYTNSDLLPFFIPLYVNDNIIDYEFVLNDIGVNHSAYIFKGQILLNKYNNMFYYESVKDVLENVTYE